MSSPRFILVNNIKLPINASEQEAFSVAAREIKKATGISRAALSFSIYRRSIDARRKDDIKFVYSVAVSGDFDKVSEQRLMRYSLSFINSSLDLKIELGQADLSAPPVVVGSGPAGLFAALVLAENGYTPIILERGGSVAERRTEYNRFITEHYLNSEVNIQFGAGGAGTFSDGKLVTRINDPLTSYVLSRFVEFGADPAIAYIAKPHIGTDVLGTVVENIINRIISLGGKIEYHTKFISPITQNGVVTGVMTNKGSLPCGALILAIGHSSRDTYEQLMNTGILIEPKDFSVGMRIEHLKKDIDVALYGDFAGNARLGAAEYHLSHDTKNRGVYTFCMCPGGEVVAAASEDGGVVVNGMSNSRRDGVNSNSAVVCTVFKSDYGSTPQKAIDFQRNIEKRAYIAGGGSYSAPIITVGDFLTDRCSSEPSTVIPTYMNGKNVHLAKPEEYLPDFVSNSIKNALTAFGKKIEGFDSQAAILTGAETRTSAPVRILRNNETRLAVGYSNLYPVGEGAGYAGGITSAAIDAVKSALEFIKIYRPQK